MKQERFQKIEEIKKELSDFKESPLYKYRIDNNYLPVVGEGDLFAKVMFVGEAPGEKEAQTGKPFVGSAGKILDEVLKSVGIEKKEVYITNLVNDRPLRNRIPNIAEMKLYSPFLMRQIQIIKPRLIVTLGRLSTNFVLKEYNLKDKPDSMGKVHGKIFTVNSSYGKIFIIPMYHPASVLYQRDIKNILKEDMKTLKNKLKNLN